VEPEEEFTSGFKKLVFLKRGLPLSSKFPGTEVAVFYEKETGFLHDLGKKN
jgi:hypothetical protein